MSGAMGDSNASQSDRKEVVSGQAPHPDVTANEGTLPTTAQGILPTTAQGLPSPPGEDMPPIQQTNSDSAPYSVYSAKSKWLLVFSVSMTSLLSPISAQIYLPALIPIGESLHVSAAALNLTITSYMIFQGITPMFVGSLADAGGRRPAYVACFVVYLAANIGLARASTYGAVLALRCLQSAGASSTVALCTAVVADVVTSAERGKYIGITVVPMVLAPSVGPVVGGLLAQHLGWRSIFWFLAISAVVVLVLIIALLPETCRPIVGDGSIAPPPLYRTLLQLFLRWRGRKKAAVKAERNDDDVSVTPPLTPPADATGFKFKPPNVLEAMLLLVHRSSAILLWSSSPVFSGFYCVTVAMPVLFHERYHLNETQVGLMYLPLAVGSIAAALGVGPAMTRSYKRHCARSGVAFDRRRQTDMTQLPIERARLEVGLPLQTLMGASVVGWGWAVQAHAHLAVLCVIMALLGAGLIGMSNTTSVLLVDLHPGKAGTATAANNLTRCLVGAGATAATVPLIRAIDVGWAFTIIGCLILVCLGPLTLLALKGIKWRQIKLKKKADEVL